MTSSTQDAWTDILSSFLGWRKWFYLSLFDVKARYRRTALGPMWIVVGTAISLTGMGAIWSTLFGMDMKVYFAYLVAGFILWNLISSSILGACSVFTSGNAVAIQKNAPIPMMTHVLQLVATNLIMFAHMMLVFVGAAVYGAVAVNQWTLLALPGLAILSWNLIWIGVIFGILGARFRDVEPLLSAILSVLFFVTPVVWKVEMLQDRAYFANFNPFTHFIAIVREPLLGHAPQMASVAVVAAFAITTPIIAFLVFRQARRAVVFWL